MRTLQVYYGTDPYSFDQEPYHYASKAAATSGDVEYHIAKAVQDLQKGTCYWYMVCVLDINPYTGECVCSTFSDRVTEKQKIILNPSAKGFKRPKSNFKFVAPAATMWPEPDELEDINPA